MAWAETAGADDPKAAYGVFRDEARRLDPGYRPGAVNPDGGAATQAAGRALFQGVTAIPCSLHALLKIRDRAVHPKGAFPELSRRVWEAYQAPDARASSRRLRRPREWAAARVDEPVVREKVRSLCGKRGAFVPADAHPGCHRTSTPVGRLSRRLDDHLDCGRHPHGSPTAAERGLRGGESIPDFAPSCPETVRESAGLRSPAERLNGRRYHAERLQNLLVSASLGGYRSPPRKA
jgi:hypothetical protein